MFGIENAASLAVARSVSSAPAELYGAGARPLDTRGGTIQHGN